LKCRLPKGSLEVPPASKSSSGIPVCPRGLLGSACQPVGHASGACQGCCSFHEVPTRVLEGGQPAALSQWQLLPSGSHRAILSPPNCPQGLKWRQPTPPLGEALACGRTACFTWSASGQARAVPCRCMRRVCQSTRAHRKGPPFKSLQGLPSGPPCGCWAGAVVALAGKARRWRRMCPCKEHEVESRCPSGTPCLQQCAGDL